MCQVAGMAPQDIDPLEAIEMELDEEEDAAVYEHLYDDKPFLQTKMVNGPSYRQWKLPLPVSALLKDEGNPDTDSDSTGKVEPEPCRTAALEVQGIGLFE